MYKTHFAINVAIAGVQATRLEIMEIRCRADLAIGLFTRHPELDVIFLHLTHTEIASAINDDMIGNTQKLDEFFGVPVDPLVMLHERRAVAAPGVEMSFQGDWADLDVARL